MGNEIAVWKLKPGITLQQVRDAITHSEPEGEEEVPRFVDKKYGKAKMRALLAPALARYVVSPDQCSPELARWIADELLTELPKELEREAIAAIETDSIAFQPGELMLFNLPRDPFGQLAEMFEMFSAAGCVSYNTSDDTIYGFTGKAGPKPKAQRARGNQDLVQPARTMVPEAFDRMTADEVEAVLTKYARLLKQAEYEDRKMSMLEQSAVLLHLIGETEEARKLLQTHIDSSKRISYPTPKDYFDRMLQILAHSR